jgi:hypothetical protein
MPRARDDEFQLRFPVARDRTLRRIGLTRMTLGISLMACLIIALVVSSNTSMSTGLNSVYDFVIVAMVACLAAIVVVFIIVEVYVGLVFTRRYGWRAVSDPIEAHRVASREALHDVAIGNPHGMPGNRPRLTDPDFDTAATPSNSAD